MQHERRPISIPRPVGKGKGTWWKRLEHERRPISIPPPTASFTVCKQNRRGSEGSGWYKRVRDFGLSTGPESGVLPLQFVFCARNRVNSRAWRAFCGVYVCCYFNVTVLCQPHYRGKQARIGERFSQALKGQGIPPSWLFSLRCNLCV